MKKAILLLAIIAVGTFSLQAQDYASIQTNAFLAFDTAFKAELPARTALANKLSMIAKKYNTEWTAFYYDAYAKIMLSYDEKDDKRKDAFIDEAEADYDAMMALIGKPTDESHILAAMVANGRMAVAPQKRWQKYGKIFDAELDAAKEMNPNNPRIYFLRGVSKFYTPKMFGGGKKAARPYFDKAKELFDANPSTDIRQPFWGAPQTDWHLAQINGAKDEE
jgi:hypothetical protein